MAGRGLYGSGMDPKPTKVVVHLRGDDLADLACAVTIEKLSRAEVVRRAIRAYARILRTEVHERGAV